MRRVLLHSSTATGLCFVTLFAFLVFIAPGLRSQSISKDPAADNAAQLVTQGRQIFRFDTFGDQTFWGDTLKLHQAIAGSGLGGVGPGVSPKTALSVGLKVDVDALPRNLVGCPSDRVSDPAGGI